MQNRSETSMKISAKQLREMGQLRYESFLREIAFAKSEIMPDTQLQLSVQGKMEYVRSLADFARQYGIRSSTELKRFVQLMTKHDLKLPVPKQIVETLKDTGKSEKSRIESIQLWVESERISLIEIIL